MYGSVLWDLSNPCIESACTTWRRGLRRVFGLPFNAHSSLLPLLSCSLPVHDELFKRSILFAQRCLVSDSALVRNVAYHGIKYNQMQSPLGKNIVSSCIHYNVAIDDFLSLTHNYIFFKVFSNISDDMFNTVQTLLELTSIWSGQFRFSSASISKFDANILIDWLSTK